ncbi:MAG: rhomboid family intramembrane serine protease [Flavobacterium sp.]
MMQITPTVKQLIIINVLVFIGSQIPGIRDLSYDYFSLYSFENPNFHFWQLLTHMFMHAPFPNLSHILLNMFGLYMFGSALEHYWGGKKFFFFYISCGLGAAIVNNLVSYYNNDIMSVAVGASGAIYGVIVAFAFMFPEAKLMMIFLPIPIKAKYFVPAIVAIDLFSGVTGTTIFGGGNIAHFAHVGGALVGFIMMWFWRKNSFNDRRWN